MIVGAVEDMVEQNSKKFSAFIDEKIKSLADNLKQTGRSVFENVRQLSFKSNEVSV
jgi:hypothetical protein